MKNFIIGLVAGSLSLVMLLVAAKTTVVHYFPEHLPAPAITQLEALNEKFRFLRNRPDVQPDIIAVGSSMTWRHFDGDTFQQASGRSMLNGGTSFLGVHQSRNLANFYTDLFDSDLFIIMTSLPDFENCATPASLFDPLDSVSYIRKEKGETFFYLKYLALTRYFRTGRNLPQMTMPLTGELWQDSYASSPLQVPEMGLRYGRQDFDPRCVDEITELSNDLAHKNRRLLVVFIPVHPGYLEKYPEASTQIEELHIQISNAFENTPHETILYQNKGEYAAEDFYDAFHLQAHAVTTLSRVLGEHVARSGEMTGFAEVHPRSAF